MNGDEASLIEVANLSVAYGDHTVFRNVSFSVNQASRLAPKVVSVEDTLVPQNS